MTVTLLVQKVAYVYAVLLERERFLYLLSVLRNMSYELEKIFEKFFVLFLPKNIKYEKHFDTILRPKCSLLNACTIQRNHGPCIRSQF